MINRECFGGVMYNPDRILAAYCPLILRLRRPAKTVARRPDFLSLHAVADRRRCVTGAGKDAGKTRAIQAINELQDAVRSATSVGSGAGCTASRVNHPVIDSSESSPGVYRTRRAEEVHDGLLPYQ
jgi:hypothetical protein